jgi:hypothetical protein
MWASRAVGRIRCWNSFSATSAGQCSIKTLLRPCMKLLNQLAAGVPAGAEGLSCVPLFCGHTGWIPQFEEPLRDFHRRNFTARASGSCGPRGYGSFIAGRLFGDRTSFQQAAVLN